MILVSLPMFLGLRVYRKMIAHGIDHSLTPLYFIKIKNGHNFEKAVTCTVFFSIYDTLREFKFVMYTFQPFLYSLNSMKLMCDKKKKQDFPTK